MNAWNRSSFGCLALVGALLMVHGSTPARAADPSFVGILALAVEEDVAQKLQLSDETKSQLLDLIDQREAEVGSLALEIKDLPPDARQARLAPFVAESERLGLALLTLQQRSALEQIRLARAGLETVAEENVAKTLGLSEEQQATVKTLLAQREQALTAGGEQQRQATRADFERRLLEVLTREQRANWERMAGLAEGAVQVAQAEPPAEDQPAPPQPAPEPPETPQPAPEKPETPPQPGPDKPETPSDPPETPAPPQPAPDSTPATDPESDPEAEPAPRELKNLDEVELRFNFQYAAWKDVVEWLAEQADLSLLMDVVPPGTFNYSDPRVYSPTEAIDLINSVLLTKDFTLVRRERLLMVINLEDGIPEELVEFVPLTELDKRGEFEIVKTLFQLVKMDPANAEAEISPLLGPGRSMVVMPQSRQLLVTETAGNLRVIRSVIQRIEEPDQKDEAVLEVKLNFVTSEDILQVARPLLGLGEEENVNDEIQIAVDPLGTRLFVTGTEDKIKRLKELVPLIDRESELTPGAAALEQPQLETYAIAAADPEQVLAVLQTLLAGLPDTRLAIDPVSGKLIALARPSDHKTILATLRQLEGQADQLEVIQLRTLDPQLVVLTLNKLYPAEGGEEGQSSLKVDGDPTTGKLWVRGPQEQIDQVKQLVEKLEAANTLPGGDGGNVRLLPYTGNAARAALDNLETLWPAIRPNRIRVVTPSNAIRAMQGIERFPGRERPETRPSEPETAPRPAAAEEPPAVPPVDRATRRGERAKIRFIFTATALEQQAGSEGSTEQSAEQPADGGAANPGEGGTQGENGKDAGTDRDEPREPAADAQAAPDEAPESEARSPSDLPGQPAVPAEPKKASDIVVTMTPQGLVIASEDVEALDEFESLLRTLSGGAAVETVEPTVFWLKYAKASEARALLNEILGGGGGGGTGGGSLLGDVASNVLGGVGGGLLGGLLGGGMDDGGGTLQATGSVSIVADNRLNALVVQANAVDLSLIEQLLQVIDQESSPEDVQTSGKPRVIPVRYVPVEEVATVVRQVYASRLESSGGGGESRQRQPDPAEFIRALRGGGGGRGGNNRQAGGEEQKMTLGVDARTNSLIVAAPEPLFREVEALVELIDIEDATNSEDVQVVTVPGANPEAVKSALAAVLGQPTPSPGSSASSSSSQTSRGSDSGGGQPSGGTTPEQIQQRIEFFRRLRESGGFGGRGGGDSPRSFGGGRGGPPGGGFGGRRGGGR